MNACRFDTFKIHFDTGKSQIVWQWVAADLDTPVSAYLKLCRSLPFGFLLESVEGGTVLGRYSAIGLKPDFFWRYQNGKAQVSTDSKKWAVTDGDPLLSLKKSVDDCRIDIVDPGLPPMAPSGLFGYMGYDAIRLVEKIPDKNPDELGVPESLMIRPTVMVIFDNVRHMMCLATPVRPDKATDARKAYDAAQKRLKTTLKDLRKPLPQSVTASRSKLKTPLAVSSNMKPAAFHDMVRRAIDYIRAGDIFQVVLSQRFSTPFDLPPFDLYRSLRRVNPSPFLFFLNFGSFAITGSSPEILVRVRDDTVTIRPIAGTRRRGVDATEDKALAADLLADPKECAEHLMLLDLGRNDVGRVAQTGSVRVTEKFIIEYYSHVMHIVSNVEGKLKSGASSLDALFAGFPAGTVSGAPKIRAMEIIDELEPLRRSFYGGCIGYLDGNGDVDTCIALRTALVKDGMLHVQAGAGIVADSIPDSEFQETENKARAIIRAAEIAVEDSLA